MPLGWIDVGDAISATRVESLYRPVRRPYIPVRSLKGGSLAPFSCFKCLVCTIYYDKWRKCQQRFCEINQIQMHGSPFQHGWRRQDRADVTASGQVCCARSEGCRGSARAHDGVDRWPKTPMDRWCSFADHIREASRSPVDLPSCNPLAGRVKKSRGRRVPTKDMGVRTGTTYTCKVEGCRKVFIRSEHLKRHVRSLHTLEKRYFCALPFCDKAFARRDNMLQHERKHKDYQAFFDCSSGDYNGIKQIEHHPDPEPMPEDPDGEPWWTKLYLPFTPDNPPILRAPIFDNAQGFSSAASQPPPTGGFFTFSAHAPTM
ncbi:hypothetical protein B0H21DRAFT_93485 [Amylocystis lapponica]|nr:hypothetical protein B0H21DRAFT_93485 [Amylocystis lapponica]